MKVTCIICTKDPELYYLNRAIDSAIKQVNEVIIVDDNSKVPVVKNLNIKYKSNNFIFIRNELNIGLTKSLIKAIPFAKNELIARLDDDDYWHPDDGVIRGYRSFKNFSYSNNYSNEKIVNGEVQGAAQIPVVKEAKTNKLTEIASSFGSNIMSDIKERGVTGVMGGIADAFTGNLFDFDGKNLKPDQMKNAQIDKGESVTSKMIAALDGARSVQKQQVMSKQNSGTGKKMKIPSQPTSKSSSSSINKSLQPGL